MRALAGGVLVLALLLAGCGADERPYFAAEQTIDSNCQDGGKVDSRAFRACYRPNVAGAPEPTADERHGRLQVSEAGGPWRTLSVPHPLGARLGQPAAGHWEWAAVSPDGSWLLAQWVAECEVPIAFFVPANGGNAVAVARGRDGASTSKALGWTRDGHGIVELPSFSCGEASRRPGTYVLRPGGKPEYWRPLDELARSPSPRGGPG